MKLLLKFNLVFIVVFVVALAIAATVARELLQRQAQAEVVDRARLLMQKANAVAGYTAQQIAPLLETQMKYSFLPQSIPQYSATEVIAALKTSYPEYGYKAAMLNPTNPRDRAVEWEADIINQFRQSAANEEVVGERDTPLGRSLYVARPIRISKEVCLRCHSTPTAAPRTLLERYGPNNGFGWTLNDPIGAQIVSVPMALPLQRAAHSLGLAMAMLGALFVAMLVALNLMLWMLVVKPVRRLSQSADRVSLGELDGPELGIRSRDEIGMLAASFERMRKSLVHAMKMLDT